jgi:hypothetical protein
MSGDVAEKDGGRDHADDKALAKSVSVRRQYI